MRNQITGGALREERLINSIHNIAYSFKDDPSYMDDVVFYWSRKPIHPRISESINRETGTPRTTIMTQLNEPFEIGDMFELDDGSIWIVVYRERRQTHYEGLLERCNYMLNFGLDEDGNVIKYPVILQNATQYNSGITDSDYVTYGSAQYVAYVCIDDYTLSIDKQYRFLVDYNTKNPTAYKVTQVDTTTWVIDGKGRIRYTLAEDELRDTDNIDLMVADSSTTKDKGTEGGWF